MHSLYQAKQHKLKHLLHFPLIFWHIAAHSGNPLENLQTSINIPENKGKQSSHFQRTTQLSKFKGERSV